MQDELLKVILVDDEQLVRELLKRCIDWREAGYEIAGEASCASEALVLIDEVKPDVVFADIRMPFMDGIEFARLVFEKYPNIKVIILTGYEEFEYAKRSIKVGIADFLLKPINDGEILKAALNMKQKILAEKSRQAEYSRLRKQLEDNFPYLRERLLVQLVQNDFDPSDIKQRLEYYHIKIHFEVVQLAVIDAWRSEPREDEGEEEKLFFRMQCLELIRQYFKEDEYVSVFFDNNQRIVILNSAEALDLMECLEAVKSMLMNRLKCFVCAGIGGVYSGEHRIRLSYKEACNALDYKVIAGKNQVINYSEINFLSSGQYRLQNEQMEKMAFYLKAGMKAKALELVEAAFEEYSLSGKPRVDSMRVMAAGIVSVVLNVVTELEINLSELFDKNIRPFEEVFKLDTFPETRDYLKKLLLSVGSLIESIQSRRVNQAVQQIRNYIQQNMSDPELSLSGAAKAFYMNVSYLSRIFKQETGQTFTEYLTRLRLDKALKLLKETDMKAYQVAESIGITDSHYFGICFKKYTGMSVNDFRKQEYAQE